MINFTLDTNCMIDVAEGRNDATFVMALLDAHRRGEVNVALAASSASERQQGNYFLNNISEFDARRRDLGFDDLEILPTIVRMGVSFFGHSMIASDDMVAREELIYSVLAPNSEVNWVRFAKASGVDPEDQHSPAHFRWRNKMLDAQAFWAHEHAGRDVFVTSDARFQRLNGHPAFPDASVKCPIDAAALIGDRRGRGRNERP